MNGISIQDENDLMDLLLKFKQSHRVRNSLVIVMTDDRIIIDPNSKKFKNQDHEIGFGEGFAEGRNDLYKEIYHKNYGKKKTENEAQFR